MFNKTVGFVNAFPAVPKGRKVEENAPILFTVWQPPFRGHYPRTLFGKTLGVLRFSLLAWATALPRVDLISKDGFHGCVRDGKKYRHTGVTAENEKNGKPPKAPSVGSLKRLAAFL
ncbi:MAG: hypothetical protein Q4G00_04200 [Clostridia bacterium]|nr:hypothetical protein [Clostridia bacterium]